jgi:hypothetical protein
MAPLTETRQQRTSEVVQLALDQTSGVAVLVGVVRAVPTGGVSVAVSVWPEQL